MIYLGVALLAGSVLLLEIALTRVFAIMLWHHLAYMVVGVALLGLGAAGSLLTMRGVDTDVDVGRTARRLATLSTAYGCVVIVSFLASTYVPVATLSLLSSPTELLRLALLYVLVTSPFLLAGLALGLAITSLAGDVHRVYFFDLLGSACGGAASAWMLSHLNVASVVVLAGALGTLAGASFALAASRRSAALALPFVAVTATAFVAFSGGLPALGIPELEWSLPYAPGKELASVAREHVELRLPSSTAEIEVTRESAFPPISGGDFGYRAAKVVRSRMVTQDGTAPTMLYEGAADLSRFEFLGDSQTASVYEALQAAGSTDPRVLVVGVGGGIDVMIALAHGAGHVTGVELNRAMIDLVTVHLPEYLGDLFTPAVSPLDDRIDLVHDDGRSFAVRSDQRYDVIQLSGVDSFTALSSGAYTLAESYLYTVEAVQDFYAHLKPGGVLSYSRFLLGRPRRPRETLRLANIARSALEELGVSDPASHILVFRGHLWASTLVKAGAFTRAEVDALREFALRKGFWGILFDPLHPDGQAIEHADSAHVRRSFLGGVPDRQTTEHFLATRRDFHHLLRGDADTRRRFVADYEYDVTPSSDDSPFFFNYYKWRGLGLQPAADTAGAAGPKGSLYHPDFPVGHAILLASVVQILLLATVLIMAPLRSLQRSGVSSSVRLRVLAYFGALGLGFMLFEITLMQKMILFLGHPTHAIQLVLTALLAFAGLGSLLAGRYAIDSARGIRIVFGGLALMALGVLATLQGVLPALMAQSFGARAVAALIVIAPFGVLLGIAFPTGIRIVSARAPELLPWAWAINALLSVLGSIGCILLAMAMGFWKVWLLATLVYVLGALAFAPLADASDGVGTHG